MNSFGHDNCAVEVGYRDNWWFTSDMNYTITEITMKKNSDIFEINVFLALIAQVLPQQRAGLQVPEVVFSIVDHMSQCTQYQRTNAVIHAVFCFVVPHKEDAVQWKSEHLAEHVNLIFFDKTEFQLSGKCWPKEIFGIKRRRFYLNCISRYHQQEPTCSFRYLLLYTFLMSSFASAQAFSTLVRIATWGIPVETETWSVF